MSLLHTVAAFLVALAVLIVVHEFGHYLLARWCGVKVLRFSVGFGRPLVAWRLGRDRTEWSIAAIPFGGYVKMLDEREGEVAPEERGRAFNRQGPGKRILIVAAGPAFNFLFAILLYAGLFMHGIPEATPVVAEPEQGTPAAAAGLRGGDTVRSIDGEPVATWQELRWRMVQGALQHQKLTLETIGEKGHIATAVLDFSGFSADAIEKDVLERAGLTLYRPTLLPVIGRMEAGPAERAGLLPGDRITRVDGAPVETWAELVKAIQKSPGRELLLDVEREGRALAIAVTPDSVRSGGQTIGRVGITAREMEKFYVLTRYGPLESLGKALDKTVEISLFSLKMMGKMLTGEVSWRHLSGPVTIADFAGQSAQLGLASFITFLALISISLGVLNLLPIPLLDGGHLMYYFVEIVKGSPVSERAMELGQRVGLTLLLVMMAFAFYNDINRLFAG